MFEATKFSLKAGFIQNAASDSCEVFASKKVLTVLAGIKQHFPGVVSCKLNNYWTHLSRGRAADTMGPADASGG